MGLIQNACVADVWVCKLHLSWLGFGFAGRLLFQKIPAGMVLR